MSESGAGDHDRRPGGGMDAGVERADDGNAKATRATGAAFAGAVFVRRAAVLVSVLIGHRHVVMVMRMRVFARMHMGRIGSSADGMMGRRAMDHACGCITLQRQRNQHDPNKQALEH